MYRRTLMLPIFALLSALMVLGCKPQEADEGKPAADAAAEKPQPKPAETQPPSQADATAAAPSLATPDAGAAKEPAPPATAQGGPILATLAAAQHLPSNAAMVVAVSGYGPLTDKLGRAELSKTYKEFYEQAVATVTQQVGTNILDPSKHAEIGVDAQAPLGLSLLDMTSGAGAIFVGLTDTETFKTTLYTLANKSGLELEPSTFGNAVVLSPKGGNELNLVLRDKMAFFIFADSAEASLAQARRIANMTPANALAGHAGFQSAAKGLGAHGSDAAMYLDTSTLLKALGETDAQVKKPDSDWAKKALDEAKASGAKPEEIAFLEKQWEEEQAYQAEREKALKAEAEMMAKLTGGMGSASVGFDIQPGGILVNAHLGLTQDAFLGTLMRNGTATPRLITALNTKPMYVQYGNVEAKAYIDFFLTLLEIEGSLEDAKAALKSEYGVDVFDALFANLTGELGFAVTGKLDATQVDTPLAFLEALGGGMTVGIQDKAKAQALLDQVAASPKMVELGITRSENGRFTVPVPEWKTLHVGVTEGHIAVSEDPTFIDRVASGSADASFAQKVTHPGLKEVLMAQDSAGLWVVDSGALSFFAFALMAGDWEESKVDRTNLTPEQLKKVEAYEAVNTQLEELREAENKATLEAASTIANAFGTLAARARKTDTGVALSGGLFINTESVPKLINTTIDGALKIERTGETYRNQIQELEEKRWKLQEELSAMGVNLWGSASAKAVDEPMPEVVAPQQDAVKSPVVVPPKTDAAPKQVDPVKEEGP